MLISRTKLLLQHHTGNVKLELLINAVTRLNIDTLNSTIRNKVEEGNYSRSPADICAGLYFFASQHKINKSQRDVNLFTAVLKDLKHMQLYELQFEQLDFLLRAFAYATEPDFLQKLKDSTSVFKEIEEFLPRLADQASKEIERSNISDIVTLMISFYRLWEKGVVTKPQALKVVYNECDMYLSEYLGKSKKDITGSQFASLVE